MKQLNLIMALVLLFTIMGHTSANKNDYVRNNNTGSMHFCPAYPYPYAYDQKNGDSVTVRVIGDEYSGGLETIDGYTVVYNQQDVLEYATLSGNDELIPSGIIAKDESKRTGREKEFLKTVGKHLREPESNLKMGNVNQYGFVESTSFPQNGQNLKLLLILAEFNDKTHTKTPNDFDRLMNEEGYNVNGSSGSFRDYFLENSYGELEVNTVVTQWVTVTGSFEDYGDPKQWRQFAIDALQAAEDAGVDFSEFDNNNDGVMDGVAIVHQGPGQEKTGNPKHIWSHNSTLTNIEYDDVQIKEYIVQPELQESELTSIGVFCHEFGHMLGLPDFYDTDTDPLTNPDNFAGTYRWDLMAGGNWNNYGKTPAALNVWEKRSLGWLEPKELKTTGNYSLQNIAQTKDGYFLRTKTPNEWFIFENRQKIAGTWDEHLPGEGLLIYHVDHAYIQTTFKSNKINAVFNHQGFDIEEADQIQSIYTDANDAFTSGDFTDNTSPGAKSWAGEDTEMPIINISESNDIISFTLTDNRSLVADFSSDRKALYMNGSVSFTDETYGNVTSREWIFEGGTPATSTAQNPTVQYTKPGKYKVTLKVSNATDEDEITKLQYITVVDNSGPRLHTRGNIWYFGGWDNNATNSGAGLDFSYATKDSPPIALTDGKMETREGCAVMTDEETGELLFYTDGSKVWNNQHVEAFDGMKGHASATQSAIIVPRPGFPNRYYIFTVDCIYGDDGLNYTQLEVLDDYSINVHEKNVLIHKNANGDAIEISEKITAISHKNNKDYWVISHEKFGDKYLVYLVTKDGVQKSANEYVLGTSFDKDYSATGYLKLSPSGNKLVTFVITEGEKRGDFKGNIDIIDFDRESGSLSNCISISRENKIYGVEFSPNGDILYLSVMNKDNHILQYDLTSANIEASLQIIETKYKNTALQIAPDGKIYIAKSKELTNNGDVSEQYIDVIHNPNKFGTACNYEADYVYLDDKTSSYGLPTLIQSSFEECKYQLGRREYTCDELVGDPPSFCVPLIAKEEVEPGIIGMDFCIEYDPTYVTPTGNVSIGNVVTRGSEDAAYYINHTGHPGKVYVSIYYESTDPTAQFTGEGEIACVEFALTANYEKEKTVYFTSCELVESYQLQVKNACVDFGYARIIDDNIMEGRIIYWDTDRPVGYDRSFPKNYAPTYVHGADNSCEIQTFSAAVPDVEGYFEYDITAGEQMSIERDIPTTEEVAPVINGQDCYLAGQVTTMSTTFTPSIYQIVAMDVNYNGSVEAGDITHIQNRFLKATDEFPQTWNYPMPTQNSKDWLFIDDLTLSDPTYTQSANYPFVDGTGYCRYSVPQVPFCQQPDIQSNSTGLCNIAGSGLYHGVLLGDADGSWNDPGPNNNLKSGGGNVIINIGEAIEDEEGNLNIPIYCMDQNVYSLDFIIESFDKSALIPAGFEYTDATDGIMSKAHNDRVRFTSYSRRSEGINTSEPLYIMKFKSTKGDITEEKLGDITGYLNGKETNVTVLKSATEIIDLTGKNAEDIISIYPNPADDVVNVTNLTGVNNITLTNVTGNVAYQEQISSETKSIDVSNLSSGIYIILIKGDEFTKTEKIIIE